MSEYTRYSIAHVDNIDRFYRELNDQHVTAVVFVDYNHPCQEDVSDLGRRWMDLPYQKKWVMLKSDQPIETLPGIENRAHLFIDENPDNWSLRIANRVQVLELSFFDQPSGDLSDSNPAEDWEGIRRARNIGGAELAFMERCFQLPRTQFQSFLRRGKAYEFLESVGMPALELLDEHLLSLPAEGGAGRCMLWDEYIRWAEEL